VFEPPGKSDPLLGEEVGGGRRSNYDWLSPGLDAGLANAGWLALPVLAILGLGVLIFSVWRQLFGGRQ
jgi:hypothetical protein